MRYIIARLREQSTWVGIGALLAGVGVSINPDLWREISALGVAVAGFGAAVLSDRKE